MPKEIVHSKYHNGGLPGELETSFVQVGWTKDQDHVEIATIAPGGQVSAWDPDTKEFIPIGGSEPGWFMQLDRSGINRLIRALRRARDDSFGKDE